MLYTCFKLYYFQGSDHLSRFFLAFALQALFNNTQITIICQLPFIKNMFTIIKSY